MEVDVFFSDDSAGSSHREDRAFYKPNTGKSGSSREDTGAREFAGWQYWVALSCVVGATGIAAQSVFF